jgi:hypothetical protein
MQLTQLQHEDSVDICSHEYRSFTELQTSSTAIQTYGSVINQLPPDFLTDSAQQLSAT